MWTVGFLQPDMWGMFVGMQRQTVLILANNTLTECDGGAYGNRNDPSTDDYDRIRDKLPITPPVNTDVEGGLD